jgi:uncharacterized membrane protein YfcA
MENYLWLAVLGFFIGNYGTIVGAGGGFVLVPALLLLYPKEEPEIITCISLAVVFFNALSGSWAYARMKRIDYKSGLLFACATIPGAILGALSTTYVPRRLFDALLGILMIASSFFLFFYSNKEQEKGSKKNGYLITRNLIDKNGVAHIFSYNPVVGVGASFLIGYIASFLGIGGGIIHVPVLLRLLNFPIHIATATSHFLLAIMALTGTVVHIVTGSFSRGIRRTIALAVGVLIGAQVGASFSNRVQGRWIIRGLAIALGFVGVRILIMAL